GVPGKLDKTPGGFRSTARPTIYNYQLTINNYSSPLPPSPPAFRSYAIPMLKLWESYGKAISRA
ncbi:MAG TPA: hypothetical protein VEB42_07350, partial [Chitinophagaceae bacterium]|nr:hypothetical protein [Chitinophagaceae bacterium]